MKLMIGRPVRVVFAVSLMALASFHFASSQAEEAAPLPDYVIEAFGHPPTVPNGPLSADLKAAVRVVFIDSVQQSLWGQEQARALEEIARSGDPRLAWIISAMMRFTWQQSF
ncbi:MAG: hypothetical protein AAF416_22975, partial [Pseudomonadota bacterium]